MSRGCEVLWDAERADRVQHLIEDALGGPCPCTVALVCPLLSSRILPRPVMRKDAAAAHK